MVQCLQVPIPDDMKATVSARRAELVERVAEADETVGELFLMEEPVDADTLRGGIRRATLALKFVPVFMGRFATLNFHPNPNQAVHVVYAVQLAVNK